MPGRRLKGKQLETPLVADVSSSETTGITAGTTQTQNGATALTKSINVVSTCANSGDGVKLPSGANILVCEIYNDGAQPLKMWPASGQNFIGSASNAACPTLLPSTEWVRFRYVGSEWRNN